MMEDHQTLTSPDGSSNGKPPERCPRPLYSHRDSTQEDLTIPHHHQHKEQMDFKAEVKEEEEEISVMGYPLNAENNGMTMINKQVEPFPDISTDGSSNGKPPERCPRPLYSHRDSTQEDLTIPHHQQDEEQKDIKVEVKKEEEETFWSGDQQPMEDGPQYSHRDSSQDDLTIPHHHQDEEQKDIKHEVKKEKEMFLGGYEQPMEEGGSLYSQDITQGEQNIPQHNQCEEPKDIKVEVKKEEEETFLSGDQQSMEDGPLYSNQDSNQNFPTILPHHQDKEQKDIKLEVKREEEEMYLGGYEQSMEEGGSLYSQDIPQEEQNIPQHNQCGELKDNKVEVKEEEEEMLVRGDQQFMEEMMMMKYKQESSLHTDTKMDPNTSNRGRKQKRRSYKAGFKLKVISRAEESSINIASREFGVGEKQVRVWRKMKADLEKIPKAKKARRGLSTSYEALETELYKWVIERRQSGDCVTRMRIRLRALEMAKDERLKAPGVENFVASGGWCSRFMNRFNLCLRQRTNISRESPEVLDEKVMAFHAFIISQRRIHNYDLGDIGNMDGTPMTFDLPKIRTVAGFGDQTTLLKGKRKYHFTVVLSCLANGTKLQPVIIFKRKTLPKMVTFPPGITVRAHIKGWMDEDGTKKWLEEIWNERPGAALENKPSLLVCDMFRGHTSDDIENLVKSSQVTLAVIPSGLTSVLQPLDVCLNKPFKDRVRNMWHEWISSGQGRPTKAGNVLRPDMALIARWIRDAWEEIPEDMVQRAFKKCGISNAMDGSEDSAMYEDDSSDDDCELSDDDDDDDDSELTDDDDDDDCELTDDDNVYANNLTPHQAEALFGHTDDGQEFSFKGL